MVSALDKAMPLVSVLTPVYNGEPYLSECIESVLAQDYRNWEYVIVNNRSTDTSLETAQSFARRDPRIRVIDNERFVDVIQNHNRAFEAASRESVYCKVVSADDWLYPECISRMVEVAERHPQAAIVGSYAIAGDKVNYLGLPLKREYFPGREVGRLRLLGAGILGCPTSVLYRSSVVRSQRPFFAVETPNADIDTCFRVLTQADFGFVHQILSFIRTHDRSVSSKLMKLDSFLVDKIEFLVRYGPYYLSKEECEVRLEAIMEEYYQHLADSTISCWDPAFNRYHRSRMVAMGLEISSRKLAMAIAAKIVNGIFNPKLLGEKIVRRFIANKPR